MGFESMKFPRRADNLAEGDYLPMYEATIKEVLPGKSHDKKKLVFDRIVTTDDKDSVEVDSDETFSVR